MKSFYLIPSLKGHSFFSFPALVAVALLWSGYSPRAEATLIEEVSACKAEFDQREVKGEELQAIKSWLKFRFSEYPSKFSMRYGNASSATTANHSAGEEVISFGSGPDLFAPMVNFPLARRYHLADSLMGWGKGTGNVLWEITQRARAVHPTAKLSLVQPGFLEYFPKEMKDEFQRWILEASPRVPKKKVLSFHLLNSDYAQRNELVEAGYLKPLVLKLEWDFEGEGLITREIWIHLLDYNHSDDLAEMDRHIDLSSLAGIIVEGAPFPNDLNRYVRALRPGGQAVLETYSDSKNQRSLVATFRSSSEYRVKLVHMSTYHRHGEKRLTEQKLYVVTKKEALEKR
jgi:hypothetical protein